MQHRQCSSSLLGDLLSAYSLAGRVEFTEYFPENTQGVLVQPIGEDGVLVCGTDTQRGFGRLDQVRLTWFSCSQSITQVCLLTRVYSLVKV